MAGDWDAAFHNERGDDTRASLNKALDLYASRNKSHKLNSVVIDVASSMDEMPGFTEFLGPSGVSAYMKGVTQLRGLNFGPLSPEVEHIRNQDWKQFVKLIR